MGVRDVVRVRVEGVRKQVDNIYDFITKPVGPFETLDNVVKTFRETNRKSVETLGVRVPFTQRARLGILRR